MNLYRIVFEVEKESDKIDVMEEFIVADSFKQVYEHVKRQDNETFSLIHIKKEVPVIAVLTMECKEDDLTCSDCSDKKCTYRDVYDTACRHIKQRSVKNDK